MYIRRFEPEDLEEKKEVHRKSIREIASEDYSREQIEAWSNFSDYGGREENVERWVAKEDDKIIGFSDYRKDDGVITGVYVHPDYKRKGVGSRLLEEVVKDAKEKGFERLTCEASITAKNFYQNHGFEVIKQVWHENDGTEMKAFKMMKELT